MGAYILSREDSVEQGPREFFLLVCDGGEQQVVETMLPSIPVRVFPIHEEFEGSIIFYWEKVTDVINVHFNMIRILFHIILHFLQ